MSLKPLNDRIIVEPSEAETRTASGLVLPDSAQEKPQKGKVLAVGPGKRLDNGTLAKPDVSVGDMVLYGKYSGTEVKLSGKEYVILRAEDVLGILVGEKSAARAPVAKSSKANSPAKQRPAKSKVAAKPKAAKATPKAKTAKAKPAKSKAMKMAPKTKAIKAEPAKKAAPKAKPTKKGKK